MPRNKLPFWIRAIEGPGTGGSGSQTPPPGAPAAGEAGSSQETPPAGDTPKGDGDQGTPAEAKSKEASETPTAAELAAEREKTSTLQAELDKLRAAEEARAREQMTELEKAQADIKKLQEENAGLTDELSKRDRDKAIADLAREFKIPPAMTGRIHGTTPEELRADAEALAKEIGPYNGPADDSIGRGGGQGPTQHTTLGAALAAHYEK